MVAPFKNSTYNTRETCLFAIFDMYKDYPGITQITLHYPVVFCYSPITYQTRKLYYHKTLLSKNL